MPTCQNCDNEWSWKQTCKKYFTLDTGMACPYCGEKQYVTSRSRKKSSIFLFIGPALMLINLFFGPSLIVLFILLGSFPLIVGVYPLMIELTSKEELPW